MVSRRMVKEFNRNRFEDYIMESLDDDVARQLIDGINRAVRTIVRDVADEAVRDIDDYISDADVDMEDFEEEYGDPESFARGRVSSVFESITDNIADWLVLPRI